MPQHTDPGKKRTYKPVRPLTSETLLRVLVGISQGDIHDPHQANKSVERTIQIMVAYAAVAGLTLFFLTIPSFINDSGGLDTAVFVSFVCTAIEIATVKTILMGKVSLFESAEDFHKRMWPDINKK